MFYKRSSKGFMHQTRPKYDRKYMNNLPAALCFFAVSRGLVKMPASRYTGWNKMGLACRVSLAISGRMRNPDRSRPCPKRTAVRFELDTTCLLNVLTASLYRSATRCLPSWNKTQQTKNKTHTLWRGEFIHIVPQTTLNTAPGDHFGGRIISLKHIRRL